MKKVKANTRHSVIMSEHLARKMHIRLEKAKQMTKETTHKCIQTTVHPIIGQYRLYHLDLHIYILSGKRYVDLVSDGTKLLAHNAGDFVLSDGTFTEYYPSESKQQMSEFQKK